MKTIGDILGGVIILAGTLVLIAIILGLPLMLLWNWLMPVIFGLKFITFWQAVGLNVLSGIIFKSPTSTAKKD